MTDDIKIIKKDRRSENINDRLKHIAINLGVIQKLQNLIICDVNHLEKQINGMKNNKPETKKGATPE